jgi:hypothetical protein
LAIGYIEEFPGQITSNSKLLKFIKFKFHAHLFPKGSLNFNSNYVLDFK